MPRCSFPSLLPRPLLPPSNHRQYSSTIYTTNYHASDSKISKRRETARQRKQKDDERTNQQRSKEGEGKQNLHATKGREREQRGKEEGAHQELGRRNVNKKEDKEERRRSKPVLLLLLDEERDERERKCKKKIGGASTSGEQDKLSGKGEITKGG